jgi:PKD repeat protein
VNPALTKHIFPLSSVFYNQPMKHIYFFLIASLCIATPTATLAQKEANKWLFGNNGGLDFNSGAPLPFPGGQTFTSEGSASVADANGNLLFYTDGITVWNRNHIQMPNGFGLLGGFSSSQSAIIVLLPGSTTQYYVFTVGQTFTDFNYSIVDMTLQAGNGDVTVKNTLISTSVCEKLCAVKKPNGLDFWIIVHDAFTSEFDAYTFTSAGLNLVPVVSFAGTANSGDIGYMKSSPDGTKLATALWNSGNLFELFDFNKSTGIVSNALTLPFHAAGSGAYGIEFSPNNRYLYCAWITPGDVRQYDVQAGSAAAIVASEVFLGSTAVAFNGALQLGPDKKIYLAQYGAGYLGVINNPDVGGVGCNFVDVGPVISGISQLGLPNYPSYYFNPSVAFRDTCFGDTTFFNIGDTSIYTSVSWNFSDIASGIYNTSTQFYPWHIFTSTGTFLVKLVRTYTNGSMDSVIVPVQIIQCASLQAQFQSVDSTICPGTCSDFTNMSVNATSYQWFFPGGSPSVSNDVDPSNICYANPGSYDVTLIASDGTTNDTLVFINYVTVYPFPAPQGISQSGDTLFANQGANSYQWYYNGNIIAGATGYFYVAMASGSYNVVATDANGCEVEAVIFDVIANIQSTIDNIQLTVFPNPVDETLYVNSYSLIGTAFEISVYNMLGEKVISSLRTPNSQLPTQLYCRLLPCGIYWLEITADKKILRIKFLKK